MPILLNENNSNTLLTVIEKQFEYIASEYSEYEWIFYGITCYFKREAAKELAKKIYNATNSRLSGFHILIDKNEWLKECFDLDCLIDDICKITNLPTKAISFTPIAPKGSKLFHAKSYGLINSNHNIIKDYRGCAIITSANLTKAGISKNVEIGQIIFDRNSLEDFYNILLHLKKEYSLSEEEIVDIKKAHQEFQTAIRVLSMGSFYHQWKQKHKIDLRFRLILSAEEIEKRKKKIDESRRYIGYESDNGAKSISRDPIDIQAFFNKFPKPIPEKFLGYYGVDTLLGKWVPNKISDLIENKLNYITDIYLQLLKEKLNQELNGCLEQLEWDLDHFKHEEIIDRTDQHNNEAISKWTDKIKNIIKDKNLLKLLIWEYEKIPMSINSVQEP
ncbi:MAG: hypothetical protein WBA39_23735, partial [Rivularia sp. (in: cyanobacteria)]